MIRFTMQAIQPTLHNLSSRSQQPVVSNLKLKFASAEKPGEKIALEEIVTGSSFHEQVVVNVICCKFYSSGVAEQQTNTTVSIWRISPKESFSAQDNLLFPYLSICKFNKIP